MIHDFHPAELHTMDGAVAGTGLFKIRGGAWHNDCGVPQGDGTAEKNAIRVNIMLGAAGLCILHVALTQALNPEP